MLQPRKSLQIYSQNQAEVIAELLEISNSRGGFAAAKRARKVSIFDHLALRARADLLSFRRGRGKCFDRTLQFSVKSGPAVGNFPFETICIPSWDRGMRGVNSVIRNVEAPQNRLSGLRQCCGAGHTTISTFDPNLSPADIVESNLHIAIKGNCFTVITDSN